MFKKISCSMLVFVGANYLFAQNTRVQYPAGSVFENKKVYRFKEAEYKLSSPVQLVVDQIVFGGTVYTEGFPLTLIAREIVFESNSCIRSFSTVAPPNGVKAPPAAKGINNPIHTGKGGPGAHGITGPAKAAIGGMQNPGRVIIYAQRIVGVPCVMADGQTGGKGATGGDGGQGGAGGPGLPGISVPVFGLFFGGNKAGKGARGGRGGNGGKGGTGGTGGDSVPLMFVFDSASEESGKHRITSNPGLGGMGGDPGEPGAGGEGGIGGPGDSSWFGPSIKQGDQGDTGPIGGPGLPGDIGQIGKQSDFLVKYLESLNSIRLKVISSWTEFNWLRNYELLISDSLRLSLSLEASRAQIANKMKGDFGEFYNEIDEEYVKQIIFAWENYFISELQKIPDDQQSVFLKGILGSSKSFVAYLKESFKEEQYELRNKKVQDVMLEVQKLRTAILGSAVASCKNFNNELKSLLNSNWDKEYLALLGFVEVPVCSGNPDFSKQENILADILLGKSLQTLAVPESLSNEFTLSFNSKGTSIFHKIAQFFLPLSYAQDAGGFSYKGVKFAEISKESLKVETQVYLPINPAGTLIGYSALLENRVSRDNISYFLKVLASQLKEKSK